GELVEGEEAVLPVEGTEDAGLLGELQRTRVGLSGGRRELQPPVGDQEDAPRDRRQRPGIGALEVVGDQLFDLLLDDRPLEGLLGGGDLLLEKLPVDPGGRLFLPPGRLSRTEGKDLKPNQRLQIRAGEQRLVEPDAELIEPQRGYRQHRVPPFCRSGLYGTG